MGLSPEADEEPPTSPSDAPFRLLALATAAWAFVTILLGATVTFTGSALDCSTWPGCFPNEFIPTGGGGSLIEFVHRASALVLSLLSFSLFLMACFTRQATRGVRQLTAVGFLLVIAQALVGGAIIYTQASTDVVVLHLGLAVLLFGVLLLVVALTEVPHLPRRWQVALLGGAVPPRPAGARSRGQGDPPRSEAGEAPGPGRSRAPP